MERPNRKRLLQVGIIFVVASVVLFGFSVYLINSNIVSASNVIIPANSSYTLPNGQVSAGDDIDFTVNTGSMSDLNVTAYILYDSGYTSGQVNLSGKYSVTNVIVSKYAGNISLVISNQGPSPITVNATLGMVNYYTLLTTVLGFVLLPSGIVLIGIYSYSRYIERKKEKLMGDFVK